MTVTGERVAGGVARIAVPLPWLPTPYRHSLKANMAFRQA